MAKARAKATKATKAQRSSAAVQFRLPPDEKAAFERAAAECCNNLTTWIRTTLRRAAGLKAWR